VLRVGVQHRDQPFAAKIFPFYDTDMKDEEASFMCCAAYNIKQAFYRGGVCLSYD
jgi:hypothetical protein